MQTAILLYIIFGQSYLIWVSTYGGFIGFFDKATKKRHSSIAILTSLIISLIFWPIFFTRWITKSKS